MTEKFVLSIYFTTAIDKMESFLKNGGMFEKLFDKMPVGMVITDKSGRALAANREIQKMLGYSEREFREKENSAFYIREGDREKLYQALGRKGEVIDLEIPIKHKTGNVVWLDINISEMTFGKENPCYLLVAIDITERMRAEMELRENLENTRLILEAIPGMVFRLDRDGIFLDYKADNSDLFREPEEFLGKRFTEVLPPQVSGVMEKHFKSALENREVQEFEYELDVGGKKRFWQARLAGNPKKRYVIGSVHDVTDIKDAFEKKLTVDRRIQEAQKLESMGIMAGGIAHDFNNILMAVIGNAEMAMEMVDSTSAARANIEEILAASSRAVDLTGQMLAYSGRGKFNVTSARLSSLVKDMKNLISSAVSKHIKVGYNLKDELPVILCDPTQIKQVLINIVINASEAIEEDHGTITISTGTTRPEEERGGILRPSAEGATEDPGPRGECVYLEVADTGSGMSDEVKTRIFEPFFTTKFTGRGLGMAAVEGIVRGHRGLIKIDSAEGEGTVVRVIFPAGGGKRADLPNEMKKRPEQGKTIDIEGKILVVDDEEAVKNLACRLLEYSGFETIPASDGRAALTQFRRRRDEISCVLLDLTMPHMDGEKTFREIRGLSSEIPVIITSGYNEKDAMDRFKSLAPSGFLKKPYKRKNLLNKLREVMGESPS